MFEDTITTLDVIVVIAILVTTLGIIAFIMDYDEDDKELEQIESDIDNYINKQEWK